MILIALGANLPSPAGPPEATFKAALRMLSEAGVFHVTALSRIFRSPAWPDPALPEFCNAVACVESSHGPRFLLSLMHEVEAAFGRERGADNAPRPLDLDLLDFEGQFLEGDVILPHPRLHERAFVLLPLQDVAPKWRHPLLGLVPAEMIATLPKALLAGVEPV